MYIGVVTWYFIEEERNVPEMTDIRCEECGAVFPMIVGTTRRERDHTWHPGRKCPICGSEKFFPVPKTDGFEPKPIAKWKLDRRVGIAAGVVIFVFVIIGLVLHFHEKPHREGGLKAVYMCDKCGKLFVRGVTRKVPTKCPECKERAGYRAVQCLNCYTVYPLKGSDAPHQSQICPECKSRAARILVRLSDIKKKPPKQEEEGETNEEEEGVHPD
jgi:DNA-directed RNA polymerase subunit RPC12/RpoP